MLLERASLVHLNIVCIYCLDLRLFVYIILCDPHFLKRLLFFRYKELFGHLQIAFIYIKESLSEIKETKTGINYLRSNLTN